MISRIRTVLLRFAQRDPEAILYAQRFFGWGFVFGIFGHVLVTHGFVIKPTYGVSMAPTMDQSGEIVLVSKLYRRGRNVEVGDVVTLKHPILVGEGLMKRVIGMPGDFVLKDSPGRGSGMMIQVPEGHCWVAGDNQEFSRDSRLFGPQSLAMIKGKAIATVWPPSRMKWFKNTLEEAWDMDEDEVD